MLGAVRVGIEGIPVIIRFKTLILGHGQVNEICIEGIPVIIRFKTSFFFFSHNYQSTRVLKVFQL